MFRLAAAEIEGAPCQAKTTPRTSPVEVCKELPVTALATGILDLHSRRVVASAGSREFSAENRIGGDTPQLVCEADPRKRPDDPLRRIKLPRLHSIPVVVRKLMMVVMVASPKVTMDISHESRALHLREYVCLPM